MFSIIRAYDCELSQMISDFLSDSFVFSRSIDKFDRDKYIRYSVRFAIFVISFILLFGSNESQFLACRNQESIGLWSRTMTTKSLDKFLWTRSDLEQFDGKHWFVVFRKWMNMQITVEAEINCVSGEKWCVSWKLLVNRVKCSYRDVNERESCYSIRRQNFSRRLTVVCNWLLYSILLTRAGYTLSPSMSFPLLVNLDEITVLEDKRNNFLCRRSRKNIVLLCRRKWQIFS